MTLRRTHHIQGGSTVDNTDTQAHKAPNGVDKAARAREAVSKTAEEVEVTIQETAGSAHAANAWFVDNVKRLLTAGLGAFALSYDEAEKFVGKLVERGQIAQKDGERLLTEVRGRLPMRVPELPPAEQVAGRVEHGMEEFLNRLNIPSKRDIDELSAKVAQLSARVEELRKAK
jgi:poly(hydroxyalkanoate) granule-associated protein